MKIICIIFVFDFSIDICIIKYGEFMKYFFAVLTIVILSSVLSANAQNQMRVGGEVGIQLPMGDFGDAAKTGFGISGIFHYQVEPNIIVGGTIGYQSWSGEYNMYSFSNIPIMGIFNYMFSTEKFRPFVGAELGLNSTTTSVEYFGVSGSDSEMNLGFNLLGGVEYDINEKLILRANVKYNIIFEDSNITFFGINAGVMYRI